MTSLVMHSEARIAFEKEVRQHPKIMMKLMLVANENGGGVEEGEVVGLVAAEFNIIMDGMYSRDQMEDLYTMLFHRLRDSRKETIRGSKLILPPGIRGMH